RRVRHDREGGHAPGHGDRGRRRGELRLALADARRRHRHGLRADGDGRAGNRDLDRRPRQAAARAHRAKADLQARGVLVAAAETYPDDLKYHSEHDWARIDGDEAVLGITWYAQDALGELVHYEAPDVGSTVTKDASYGEVESVKAVSDLIAPLSGEVLEVNEKVVDAPETVNEDPYGDGWLIRVRMTVPAERDQLLSLEQYRKVLEEA